MSDWMPLVALTLMMGPGLYVLVTGIDQRDCLKRKFKKRYGGNGLRVYNG
jgi:hypothetical protein